MSSVRDCILQMRRGVRGKPSPSLFLSKPRMQFTFRSFYRFPDMTKAEIRQNNRVLELKVCELCAKWFLRKISFKLDEKRKIVIMAPTICRKCALELDEQLLLHEDPAHLTDLNDLIKETFKEQVQKYRRTGGAHIDARKVKKSSEDKEKPKLRKALQWVQDLYALFKDKGRLTAKDIAGAMKSTQNGSICVAYAKRMGFWLEVVGFIPRPEGRKGRPLCIYSLAESMPKI